jgi:hypothetical protein
MKRREPRFDDSSRPIDVPYLPINGVWQATVFVKLDKHDPICWQSDSQAIYSVLSE